jgi:hypothetical protein
VRTALIRRPLALSLIAVIAFAAALLQNAAQVGSTRAQTQQQFTGQVVNICGIVTDYTASSASAAGSMSFKENNVTTSLGIPPNLSFVGIGPSVVGSDMCLTGVINASGQIISAFIKQNVSQSATTCGVVNAWTPSTTTSLGLITIGGNTYPIAFGTSFQGTFGISSNICLALTVNGLGQITAGAAQANSSTTPSIVPVELCGTVTTFTAPTATTTGSLAFSLNGATYSYTLPAGGTISGTGPIQVGQAFCMIAPVSTGNVIAGSFLLATDFTTNVVVCGVLHDYHAGTANSLGSVTLGSSTIPISYGTSITGDVMAISSTYCITGAVNGLGQLRSGVAALVALPTATLTPFPTASSVATATGTPVPATATATPTNTPVPATATSTATATATNTPIPPPPAIASFLSTSVKYGVIRMGTRETLTAQAGFAGPQRIVVHVYFATGLQTAFNGHTNSKGRWTKSFAIPRNTISQYSSVAVVTFQIFKNHTSAKDFQTFRVVR